MTLNVTAESTFTQLILDANTTAVTINASAALNAVADFNANGATTLATIDTAAAAGHITLDAEGDIILNADGADIKLADASVTFGHLSNS